MQILIFVSLTSFLALVAMTVNKMWHVRSGKVSESHDLHLVGPLMKFSAKVAQVHGMKVYTKVKTYARPTLLQARKDMMLLAYDSSANLAKRFAKIANEIKGKGELPEGRSASSFMLAYAQKENGYEN